MTEKKEKFKIQDQQYSFPYHYLTGLDSNVPYIKKSLSWGIEYLTYMNIIQSEIEGLDIENILDVGCGDGYLLNNLNETKINKYGIDLSEKAILFAKAFSRNTTFERKDLFQIDDKFDAVSLIEVLEHIPDDFLESFMTRVLDLVKVDGYFIISVPTTVIPLNKKHYRHYNEELLSKHTENFAKLELVKEIRAYRVNKTLDLILRLLNNRYWSINSEFLLAKFWNWHKKNNFISNKEKGAHLIRIYKKIS